jgi:hypothetical protein
MNALMLQPASGQTLADDTLTKHKTGVIREIGDSILANLTVRVEPKPLSWKAIVIPVRLLRMVR